MIVNPSRRQKKVILQKPLYFCGMKRGIIALGLLIGIFSGCKNDQNNIADSKKVKDNTVILNKLMGQIAKSPDSIGLRLKLVNALDSLGNYKEAVVQIDSLINKDSLNFGLWYRKGRLLEDGKDTANAIASFTKAIKIYPSPDGQLSLANLLAETKNAHALLFCQQVQDLRLGREYSAHCNFIAGVYFARIGNKQKAIQMFDNCINENYSYLEAYQEKGFIYFDDKKYVEALKIFQLTASINNTYADAYYWQAKCLEALNKKEEAIKNYQTSILLDKNLNEASEALKRLQ
jgi:tetratricopeptide (TPR) repeat protein